MIDTTPTLANQFASITQDNMSADQPDQRQSRGSVASRIEVELPDDSPVEMNAPLEIGAGERGRFVRRWMAGFLTGETTDEDLWEWFRERFDG